MRMRWPQSGASLAILIVAVFAAGNRADAASLNVVPQEKGSAVFAGEGRQLEVSFRNSGAETVNTDVRARIYQASSSTAAPVHEFAWKPLRVLPGQTVIETPTLSFPEVRTETRFIVRWVDGGNAMLGVTDVRVFPTNLLAGLNVLGGGDSPVGVFDPDDQFKPLLQSLGVPFQDLVEDGTDKFAGKLAIFGPFPRAGQMPRTLSEDIRRLVKKGKSAVWLQPPPSESGPLRPSFHTVRIGNGVVVVAQPGLVSHLAKNPEAQLNLLRLAEFAVHPARLDWAVFEPQTNRDP